METVTFKPRSVSMHKSKLNKFTLGYISNVISHWQCTIQSGKTKGVYIIPINANLIFHQQHQRLTFPNAIITYHPLLSFN